MKEIRAWIDREYWRRLQKSQWSPAEIGTRNEGHTTGVMRQASCRRSRMRIGAYAIQTEFRIAGREASELRILL